MIVAIDGPAGAGKSTLAKKLAATFGFIYVDTGALYRGVGLFVTEKGVDTTDVDGVTALLPQIELDIRFIEGAQHIFLNGLDVSEAIRRPEMSMAASNVSAIPAVRAFLLDLQRSFGSKYSIIMDGRDIGTVVFPKADLKIFLTATPEDRARRRYEEQLARGFEVKYEDVLADVITRDRNDSTRAIAPLKQAEDAVLVDTTGFEFEQSFDCLCKIIKEKI